MRESRRSVLASALVLVLAFVVSACGGGAKPGAGGTSPAGAGAPVGSGAAQPAPAPAPKEPIKIGAILDITGPASSLGKPERDTLLMLEEQLNARGGVNGRPVKLTILDSESDETKAVLAVKKLMGEGVSALIGGTTSGASLAMIPEIEKAEIPYISVAASVKIVEPVKKWVFKTAPNDVVVLGKIVEFLKGRGAKKVAWGNVNNSFGDGGRAEFEKLAGPAGLQLVANERFNATDTDMTPQLTRIKAQGPDAVLVWTTPPSASVFTKNFKQLGLGVPLIQSHGIGNEAFIQQSGDAAEGVIFPAQPILVWETMKDGDQKKLVQTYVQDFMKKYNYFPTTFGGHAWDAWNLLIKAIGKAGDKPAAIRDALEGLGPTLVQGGTFKWSKDDHAGLDVTAMELITIKGGKWVRYTGN